MTNPSQVTLPLIPTAVVGSHGKPGWWFASVKAVEQGEFGPGDLEEMFDDAANTAIRDMETAGIDIITDGEVRRVDGYVDSYYAIIQGIAPLPVRRKAGPWGYDQQTRYEAIGRIETPPGGLGIVKEFEFLRAHTTRHTKATCAGPLTFGSNLATAGVKAKLAFHICFGNRFGRSRFSRSYEPYFPGLLKTRADQLVLEFAGRELSEVDLWKRYGEGRELGAGVIDVKGFNQDTPEDVAARIRRVLQVCSTEKLTVNPDCGFGWSPRYMCNQKLAALAAGAALVRKELSGRS